MIIILEIWSRCRFFSPLPVFPSCPIQSATVWLKSFSVFLSKLLIFGERYLELWGDRQREDCKPKALDPSSFKRMCRWVVVILVLDEGARIHWMLRVPLEKCKAWVLWVCGMYNCRYTSLDVARNLDCKAVWRKVGCLVWLFLIFKVSAHITTPAYIETMKSRLLARVSFFMHELETEATSHYWGSRMSLMQSNVVNL